MKKLTIIIMLLLIMACDLYNKILDNSYYARINQSFVYYGDFSSIYNISDIAKYINENIKYVSDNKDYWSTAKDTLLKGYGDCEDLSIVYINILYVVFNIKSDLVLIDNRNIETGGWVTHAIVRFPNGLIIDPQSGVELNCPVGYSYYFEDIFVLD